MRKDIIRSLGLLTVSHTVLHLLHVSLGAVLPLIKTELSFSYSQVGLLIFTLSILMAGASIPMGFISDQMNRRRLLSYMFLLIAILAPLLLVARSVVLVFVLFGFLWFCMAAFHPVSQAHLSHHYPSKRGAVFGFYETGGNLGMVIAPVLAVTVASLWGWRSVYLIYALPALLLALGLHRTSGGKIYGFGNSEKGLAFRFWSGLKANLHSRKLRLIHATQGAYACLVGVPMYYLPLFAVDRYQWTVSEAGYLLTLFLFGGLLGKFLGGRSSDRWGRERVIGWSFITVVPLFILLSLIQGWLVLIILCFSIGLISHMILPVLYAAIGDYTTEDLGLTYGIQSLVGFGSSAGCSLGAGILADLFGLGIIFQLIATISILGVVFSFLLAAENRRGPVRPS